MGLERPDPDGAIPERGSGHVLSREDSAIKSTTYGISQVSTEYSTVVVLRLTGSQAVEQRRQPHQQTTAATLGLWQLLRDFGKSRQAQEH